MPNFPRRYVASLQDHAARLIDARRPNTENATLARSLLGGVFDTCTRYGLDGVLAELAQAFPPIDLGDRATFYDHPTLVPALAAQLEACNLDGGGPRTARPGAIVNAITTALGLTISDEEAATTLFDDKVRADVVAALASALETELAVPQVRTTIIEGARELCDPRHFPSFDKIAAQLDERGTRVLKQPKVPIDAAQAVQRHLTDAKNALIERLARTAIDRAQAVIGRIDAGVAARIDQPVTHQLTPRDVAIARATDARVPMTPAALTDSLLLSLSELARLGWRAAEKPVLPYSATQTFVVGEVIEHPKFGRGSVVSTMGQRVDVEFTDGKVTLVHARPSK
jgi:hypothetical protein